jgi:hypothetical protein
MHRIDKDTGAFVTGRLTSVVRGFLEGAASDRLGERLSQTRSSPHLT